MQKRADAAVSEQSNRGGLTGMNFLLKLEEGACFALAYFLFTRLLLPQWSFWALLLSPDLSMLAYLYSAPSGAAVYNVFHHKALAILLFLTGAASGLIWLQAAGLVLLAHACMDRLFGYGLKYKDSFFHTHLGFIGKNK